MCSRRLEVRLFPMKFGRNEESAFPFESNDVVDWSCSRTYKRLDCMNVFVKYTVEAKQFYVS